MYEFHKILTFIFTGRLIRFGNYSCLPKKDAVRLVKEASIWSSFSGSLTKVILDRVSIPSIRGSRYYGPSQMNLFNLLVHSFSIMVVFKTAVLIRSLLFLVFYLFFIVGNFSIVTLFPVFAIFVFVFIIFKVARRENINELEDSLKNLSTGTSLELVVEDLSSSIFYLDKITEKTTKEDVLNSIFSSFCVGK